MTTLNLKKDNQDNSKPLINPILDSSSTILEPFPKFKNSFEPEVKPISDNFKIEKAKSKTGFNLFNLLFTILGNLILVSAVALLILKLFVFQQVEVDGLSMLPNFNDRDYLLMNSIDKNFVRGQVVALYSNDKFAYRATHELNPYDAYMARFDCGNPCNAKFFLKRIIGLPGEELEVANGNVIIYNKENPSGAVLKEDYIPQETKDKMKNINYHFAKVRVPEGKYFVMGDNRTNSTDSRVLGAIADYAIFGKQVVRIGNFVNNKIEQTSPNDNQVSKFITDIKNRFVVPFESYKSFDLPSYDFGSIPEEDKVLLSK
jgi:signal peptidase I